MFGRSELNDMWSAVVSVFLLSIACIFFICWLLWFTFSYSDVGCDYKTTVVVNDVSTVEWAISNVVDDVKSRNFVVTKLEVETYYDESFKVTCGGVSQANLLKR